MAREENDSGIETPAQEATRDNKSKKRNAPAKPQVSTQEAKDLRSLIGMLSEKNSPKSSKDVTEMANKTLKMVAQSQKSESVAFRKEATKALLDFRNFVEKTDKIRDSRRDELLKRIDGASLDAKNTSYMMLSIAKQQSKNMKDEAIRAITAEKIKLKEIEKATLAEAEVKAKEIRKEAKLKSQQMTAEHAAKLREITDERKQKLKDRADALNKSLQDKREKLKQDKQAAADMLFERRERLAQEKEDHKQQKESDRLKLRQDRADGALKIKELKQELRDKHTQKKMDLKESHDKLKNDQMERNKARIQKIKDMSVDHKIRLKKIEDSAKAEAVVKKLELKERVKEIHDQARERKAKHEKNADQLSDKIKTGIYEANPLIHAAVEIGTGIVGHLAKRMGDKKKEKALNTLHHTQEAGTPNTSPNTTPASPQPANPGSKDSGDSGGGMFSGLLKMLPSVTSIVEGIGSFFSGIVSVGSTMFKIIGGGAGMAWIAGAAIIVNGIFDFIDGFNNAGKLFGDKFTGSISQKLWSGFVNMGAMLWGLVDDIAHMFGFETNLKKMYQDIGLKIYDAVSSAFDSVAKAISGVFGAIVGAVKSFVGVVGTILSYVPGAGGAAKALQAWAGTQTPASGEIKAPEAPAAVTQIAAKQDTVNNLADDLAVKRAMAGPVQAVVDNSVKSNQTNIITQKLDTRNKDTTHKMYGYGGR